MRVILVVEPNGSARELIARQYRKSGCWVAEAANLFCAAQIAAGIAVDQIVFAAYRARDILVIHLLERLHSSLPGIQVTWHTFSGHPPFTSDDVS